ncbi:MAG: hypothetical protein M1833_002314 [Piccolia ochrophora]|nr:MAG: hypothetical protein M1833_002314 [Piccolia ochrophora]
MVRKNQKQGASDAAKKNEDQREDSLQAVVLADTFETRFSPFTLERPRCLLPLANTPMIEYTFEFLANAGVEEVFVYCGEDNQEQIEAYVTHSKWAQASSPLRLEVMRSKLRSVGDAMRDLDQRHVITGDFVVVSGDVVTNFPLEGALAEHRARRAADKNAIMTMVLREAGRAHRTKSRGVSPVFVIDPVKNRCLHYEQMLPKQEDKHVSVDPDLLASNSEIEIRNDLMDCQIDLCTPDVLALWTDSFDYEAPRKHFLYGVLKDYELNGKTIHTHIINDHYAARVRSLQAYDAVSKDIVSRWAYPLCPDSNLLRGQSYRFQRGNIYVEDDVVLARSCMIRRKTVIGQDTSIGDGSDVGNSIIGRRCQIGKNVTLDGAYIWDDVVISEGTQVRQAIVASEAVVGPGCTIESGALISFGVQLGKNTKVKGTSRLTKGHKRKRGSDDDATVHETDHRVVGEGGQGYELKESDDSDDDEADIVAVSGLVYSLTDLAVSNSSISTLNSESDSDEPLRHQRSAAGSFTTITSDEGREEGDFHYDAASSIFDALQRGEASDIVQLELQGLRMGVNADYHQVRKAVIAAFMKRIQHVMESQFLRTDDAVSQVLRKYAVVLEKTMFDKSQRRKEDQVDFLLTLQRDLIHRNKGESVLLFTAKELYDMDILEEEGFNQWWQDARSSLEAAMQQVRTQTQQFVEWLANAEEDSSEEDEDAASDV